MAVRADEMEVVRRCHRESVGGRGSEFGEDGSGISLRVGLRNS